MVSARRLQAGVHAALIALAIPYVWLNIGLLHAVNKNAEGPAWQDGIAAVGWLLLFAIIIYMSNRDGADPFKFTWKDRIPLACAFIHGTLSNLAIRKAVGLSEYGVRWLS
jgi:uncharacterized RDD family membrane protein YckC